MGNKKIGLSLYLMKPNTAQDECFVHPGKLKRYELSEDSLRGTLFVKETQEHTPQWLSFLSTIADGLSAEPVSRAASAVLVLEIGCGQNERLVCYAFGHGHQLLDKGRVESRFGLITALNAIDGERLRSVDTLRRADSMFNAHVQANSATQLASFGIDTYREILTHVAGSVRADYVEQLGTVLHGAENARFSVGLAAKDLAERAELLIDLHGRDDYREQFEFIDNLAAADKATSDALDARLTDEIRQSMRGGTGAFAYLDLASPRVLEPSRAVMFSYSSDSREPPCPRDGLRLSDYLATREGEAEAVDISCLKRDQVLLRVPDEEDEVLGSVYRCLIGEIELDERLYQLLEGKWYLVKNSLVEFVRSELGQVEESDIAFPAYRAGEHEAAYNVRAAEQLGAVLMDRSSPAIAQHPSRVEFCDFALVDESHAAPYVLVFAKRRKQSSTLSHLWSQAVVSLKAYLGEHGYRTEVQAELEAAGTGLAQAAAGPVRVQDYCVTFLLLEARASGRVWEALPFFSQAALHYALSELRALQVQIRLASAPTATAGTAPTDQTSSAAES